MTESTTPNTIVSEELAERLLRIEEKIDLLVRQKTVKDFYSTSEIAKLTGRAEFTVRQWCRMGRIHAVKRRCGRGLSQEWSVPHEELERFQNEGLLPLPKL